MSIAPFSFRDFGEPGAEIVVGGTPKPFLAHGARKKEEAPPPPPPPPVFSEEEMKASERDGYQKGFLEGIEEGKKQAQSAQVEIDQALTVSVELFATQYAPLFAVYRDMLKAQAAQLPGLAHAIAKKVAGDALATNATALIEEICLRCVTAMTHEPKLAITIHESMKETLEAKIRTAASTLNIAGEIIVNGDANIAPPNCRIEWKNGAMVRDTDAILRQVEQIVTSMVASHTREVETLCDDIEKSIQPTPDTPQDKGE